VADVDARGASRWPVDPELDEPVGGRGRLPRLRGRVVAAVAAGGVLGGALRYALGLALPAAPGAFPWAVFAVNTAGAFVLAVLLVLVLEVLPPTTYLRPLVGTGFCGALTTYSTFSFETLRLAEDGAGFYAVANVVGSIAAGLGAAFSGAAVASALWS
jgi:CrcB protein